MSKLQSYQAQRQIFLNHDQYPNLCCPSQHHSPNDLHKIQISLFGRILFPYNRLIQPDPLYLYNIKLQQRYLDNLVSLTFI